jgi:hypothetical protein
VLHKNCEAGIACPDFVLQYLALLNLSTQLFIEPLEFSGGSKNTKKAN